MRRIKDGVPNGIRTRVLALKGLYPRPLDDGDLLELQVQNYNLARTGFRRVKDTNESLSASRVGETVVKTGKLEGRWPASDITKAANWSASDALGVRVTLFP